MVIAGVNRAAQEAGLRTGLPIAQAQARMPGLRIEPSDPAGDAAALAELAAWCLRFAPLSCADGPDGLWIDTSGCAHLHDGEPAMLAAMHALLHRAGLIARLAIADTPGAAHALARYGAQPIAHVPPGRHAAAIADLPVAGLRLDEATSVALRRLGFDRIGALAATARAPLARRFGATLLHRLDQALGRVPEAITPVFPPALIQHRLAFPEPLCQPEAFAQVIAILMRHVCDRLEAAGLGARRLDLLFERVDGSAATLRIGTARPVRDAAHLARLLRERLDRLDPGLGVEAMRLIVPLTERLGYTQPHGGLDARVAPEIATLVDRLGNRFGADRVWRAAPVESDVPERAIRRAAPLSMPPPCRETAPRPVRLFDPPQPVIALAALPDQPPVAFTWRRLRHRVRHADGPERIHGEWWRRDGEVAAVRDYWRVEDEAGQRFWLFRRGDGASEATGDLSWFLHGLF